MERWLVLKLIVSQECLHWLCLQINAAPFQTVSSQWACVSARMREVSFWPAQLYLSLCYLFNPALTEYLVSKQCGVPLHLQQLFITCENSELWRFLTVKYKSMPLKSLTDDSLHLNLSFCNLFLHLQKQLNENFCLIVSSNQLWVHKCEQTLTLNQIYGLFDLSYIYESKYTTLSSRQMLSGHLVRVLHHPLPDVRLDFSLFPV